MILKFLICVHILSAIMHSLLMTYYLFSVQKSGRTFVPLVVQSAHSLTHVTIQEYEVDPTNQTV